MGKEDEVKKWEDKWKKQTEKDGKEIKDAIGKDSTVSILDEFDKKFTHMAITGVVVAKYYIKPLI